MWTTWPLGTPSAPSLPESRGVDPVSVHEFRQHIPENPNSLRSILWKHNGRRGQDRGNDHHRQRNRFFGERNLFSSRSLRRIQNETPARIIIAASRSRSIGIVVYSIERLKTYPAST